MKRFIKAERFKGFYCSSIVMVTELRLEHDPLANVKPPKDREMEVKRESERGAGVTSLVAMETYLLLTHSIIPEHRDRSLSDVQETEDTRHAF